MALNGNAKLLQHKPQNYRAERSSNNGTAETNDSLNPQFNALHSSQRSYSCTMLKKDQQTNSRDKKHNFLPPKQIDGPSNTKPAR